MRSSEEACLLHSPRYFDRSRGARQRVRCLQLRWLKISLPGILLTPGPCQAVRSNHQKCLGLMRRSSCLRRDVACVADWQCTTRRAEAAVLFRPPFGPALQPKMLDHPSSDMYHLSAETGTGAQAWLAVEITAKALAEPHLTAHLADSLLLNNSKHELYVRKAFSRLESHFSDKDELMFCSASFGRPAKPPFDASDFEFYFRNLNRACNGQLVLDFEGQLEVLT